MITPRIPYAPLGLKGLVTLTLRTLSVLNERHPADPFLQGSIVKLEAAEQEASRTVGATRKAMSTKTVTQADDDRDNAYEALKYVVKGGMKRSNEAVREASERLYDILKQHGLGLATLPYDEETAALVRLFEDMDKPNVQADLRTLNAQDIYAELKSHQEAFEEAVKDRGEERTTNEVLTTPEAIKLLKPRLVNLFKLLDVAEEEEIVAGIGETNSIINALIKEIVDANRRGTGSDNGEEPDIPEPGDTRNGKRLQDEEDPEEDPLMAV